MKENPELFSENAIAGVRDYLLRKGHLKEVVITFDLTSL